MVNKINRIETLVFLFLSTFVTVYLWIRGYYVPFTFDEAATFFHFIHRGDMWLFNSLPDANNHFLNSLLSYISYKTLGSDKISLRLPNLLSLIIYLFYLYKCSALIKNGTVRWIFILSLMFTHFFIEFFALTRGYGLSMAFLLGVFYNILEYSKHKKPLYLLLISLFLLLMQLSNLSVLVLVIAVIGYEILVLAFGKIKRKNLIKHVFIIVLTQIVPLVFSSFYMFYLNDKGSLYYGDSSGFWNLTVQSLILLITGTKSAYFSISLVILFIYLLLIIGFFIIKSGIKIILSPRLSLAILLLLSIFGVLLLAEIFGINHPEDRVAMYFIPLFFGAIAFSTDQIIQNTKRWFLLAPLLLLLFFPMHFLWSMNIQYVNGYREEVLPEKFFHTISNDTLSEGNRPLTIGGYRMRAFCWAYQNYQNGGSQNLIDYFQHPEYQSDYQIVDIDTNTRWLDYYNIVDSEHIMGRKLLKRKQPVSTRLFDKSIMGTKNITGSEYTRIATWQADSLIADSYLLEAKINIGTLSSPFKAWFVMQLVDEKGKSILYKYIPFDWLQPEWDHDMLFHHTLLTGPIPENLHEIKVYIWNINKVDYTITKSEIDIFEIIP